MASAGAATSLRQVHGDGGPSDDLVSLEFFESFMLHLQF